MEDLEYKHVCDDMNAYLFKVLTTNIIYSFAIFFTLTIMPQRSFSREILPLNGEWFLSYNENQNQTKVTLPGTMDEWGKGNPNQNKNETKHLSRLVTYEGKAYYTRQIEVPPSFQGQSIFLYLERTKHTTVFVNNDEVGSCNSLQTPHCYNITNQLKPGINQLTIVVDNSKNFYPAGVSNSHALVEHTQTNWNGILGNIHLEARPQCYIDSVNISPNLEKRLINIRLNISNNSQKETLANIQLQAIPHHHTKNNPLSVKTTNLTLKKGNNSIELDYPMGDAPLLWSEYTPHLYVLSTSVKIENSDDTIKTVFGMRKLSTESTQFSINGKKTYLRGKHDACVFPLTGYPPMTKNEWMDYLGKLSTYGINYIRFHSWTPPRAAFEAADELGIYLQPEIPYWGAIPDSNKEILDFYQEEGKSIIQAYSSHPSFVMLALGNELGGSTQTMKKIVDFYRTYNKDILYSFGSNNYLGREGHKQGEDFFTTCRVGEDHLNGYANHVRSSFAFADAEGGGILNACYPSTRITYKEAITSCPIPIISHEAGQFQIYPDFKQIEKYTGVLKPWNLQTFHTRIQEKNMGDQVQDFHRASGKWAAQCYKADFEIALRTPGFGGIQLLDLQDFPGQGTALVGLLDVFMDNKGAMKAEEFSSFCNQIVPLALFDRYTWFNNETLHIDLQIANYSEHDLKTPVKWTLKNKNGELIHQGLIDTKTAQGTLSPFYPITCSLKKILIPTQLILSISVAENTNPNTYNLWVYPAQLEQQAKTTCRIITDMNKDAFKDLSEGATLLWFPKHEHLTDISLDGLAIPDYWNYAMFKGISEDMKKPVSPGTLSILTNPHHPLFKNFPTDEHTDWQWWFIIKNSRPLILDATPKEFKPIIQVIDNIERNHKLGLVFEMKVGNGKLLISMINPKKMNEKPEGKQFLHALISYANSSDFNPSYICQPDEFQRIFSHKVVPPNIIKVENPTDYR